MNLNRFAILAAIAAVSLAPAQSTFTFAPKYRAGETDTYKMNMDIAGKQTMKMMMSYSQKVLKVLPNGDIQLQVKMGEGSMVMNGNTMKMPQTAQAQTVTLDKLGRPKGAGATNPMGMDLSALSSGMPTRPIRIGETVPVNTTGKDGTAVKGTYKLLSIANGIAKLALAMDITTKQAGTMTMKGIASYLVSNSKVSRMDATISGIKMLPGSTIKMLVVKG